MVAEVNILKMSKRLVAEEVHWKVLQAPGAQFGLMRLLDPGRTAWSCLLTCDEFEVSLSYRPVPLTYRWGSLKVYGAQVLTLGIDY